MYVQEKKEGEEIVNSRQSGERRLQICPTLGCSPSIVQRERVHGRGKERGEKREGERGRETAGGMEA